MATSDLYQAAMTIFEMHALYLRDAAITPFDAAIKCAARTPESDFVKFSPEQTENWLAGKDGEPTSKFGPQLRGALIDNGFVGAKLLELIKSDWQEVKTIGVLAGKLKKGTHSNLKMVIQRNVSNDTTAMHPSIAKLVKGDDSSTKEVRQLSPEHSERWLEERHTTITLHDKLSTDRIFKSMDKLRGMVSGTWFDTLPGKFMALSDAFPYRPASPVSATVGLRMLSSLCVCSRWFTSPSPLSGPLSRNDVVVPRRHA